MTLEERIDEIEVVVYARRALGMLFMVWWFLLSMRVLFLHSVEDFIAEGIKQGGLPTFLPGLLTFTVWAVYAIWNLLVIYESVRLALRLYGTVAAVIAGVLATIPFVYLLVILTLTAVGDKYLKLEGIPKECMRYMGDDLRAFIRNNLTANSE